MDNAYDDSVDDDLVRPVNAGATTHYPRGAAVLDHQPKRSLGPRAIIALRLHQGSHVVQLCGGGASQNGFADSSERHGVLTRRPERLRELG